MINEEMHDDKWQRTDQHELDSLPSELKTLITNHLDYRDLCHLSLASRGWRRICNQNNAWSAIIQKEYGNKVSEKARLLYHSKQVQDKTTHTVNSSDEESNLYEEVFYKRLFGQLQTFQSWKRLQVETISDPLYLLDNKAQGSTVNALGGKRSVFTSINVNTKEPCLLEQIEDEMQERRVMREVKYLKMLQGGPNIPRLIDVYKEEIEVNFSLTTLVFEPRDTLKFGSYYSILNPELIQFISYEVLKTLEFVHSHNLSHRDIKPPSIELSSDLKKVWISNWYFVEMFLEDVNFIKPISPKVASRYFKSPEILVGDFTPTTTPVTTPPLTPSSSFIFLRNANYYNPFKLDIWSFGCVLAGMIFMKEPFFKGMNNLQQLKKIVKVLGTRDFNSFLSKYQLTPPTFIETIKPKYENRVDLHTFINDENRKLVDEQAIDLIDKLLVFDYEKRLTAAEALSHPYFKDINNNPHYTK